MMLSIQLPVTLEQKLSAYCAAHDLTEDEAVSYTHLDGYKRQA